MTAALIDRSIDRLRPIRPILSAKEKRSCVVWFVDPGTMVKVNTGQPQIIGLVFTAATSILGAYLPWRVKQTAGADSQLLGLGAMLSGGVFISVAFVHLLSDAQDDMADFSKHHGDFPFALMFCGLGLLLTLAIDEIGHGMARNSQQRKAAVRTLPDPRGETDSEGSSEDLEASSSSITPSALRVLEQRYSADTPSESASLPLLDRRPQEGTLPKDSGLRSPPPAFRMANPTATGEVNAKAILITVIFSFHSFLAGLALGIDESDSSITTLVAILSHKGLAAFALGVSLIRDGHLSGKPYLVTMAIFIVMTPLGIAVGMFLDEFENPIWVSICYSVAAGTFLYIGVCEMILKELHPTSGKPPSLKMKGLMFLLILVGFAVMVAVAVLGD